MINLATAEKALKTIYLGVVQDQLNVGINPFLAKIEKTTSDVWGKEVIICIPQGDGLYKQIRADLKNIYGTIELSDKAIRASYNSPSAFINLLNAEMENLLKSTKFNLGRMLYGDGSGKLASIVNGTRTATSTLNVDSTTNLFDGMVVDIYNKATNAKYDTMTYTKIVNVDRIKNQVHLSRKVDVNLTKNDYFVVSKFKSNEISGLGAIFSDSEELYSLNRNENPFLKPIMTVDNEFSLDVIDDTLEKLSDSDFIITSYSIKRKILDALYSQGKDLEYVSLDGGYKALAYNGIPLISDKFINSNTMYIVNSKDFKFHQLADWRWLERDYGDIIKRDKDGKYSATLVKYGELICHMPCNQAMIKFKESDER